MPNSNQFRANRYASVRLPVDVETVGGLPIAVIDRAESARLMLDIAVARRNSNEPAVVFTSANGQVLSMCARDVHIRNLFLAADLIHADGMPLVFASRLLCTTPLPERVATTDLFHDVAKMAQTRGATFFLLGATSSIIEQAVRRARMLYPGLKIVGYCNGYFGRDQETHVIDAINDARPDILWLGMGAPSEQLFAIRNRNRLRNVGLIKTSGGLFDFLVRQESSRAGLDASGRSRMGLPDIPRTQTPGRSLCDDKSARALSAADPHATSKLAGL